MTTTIISIDRRSLPCELGYNVRGAARRGCASGTLGHLGSSYRRTGLVAPPLGSLEIIATPARHAAGRISPQSDDTLWAGYALLGAQHRAWYSGDTGFHSALEEIGRRFGPFDVTLIEAGQYDKDWPDWHLGPEQPVEAHRLVRGKRMIPVHWGLLKLAHHSWTEPVERVLAAALNAATSMCWCRVPRKYSSPPAHRLACDGGLSSRGASHMKRRSLRRATESLRIALMARPAISLAVSAAVTHASRCCHSFIGPHSGRNQHII